MILAKFRQKYPQGGLVSELVEIDRGLYIVKVSVQVENIILATALAGADRVETAEDAARERAIAALMLDPEQKVLLNNSSNVINGSTTSPNSEKIPPEMFPQTPMKIEKANPPSQTSFVNFSEPQTEIPSKAKISPQETSKPEISISEKRSSNSLPESPASQPIAPEFPEFNEAVSRESPTITNPDNLFEGTLTSETLENKFSEENVIAATSSPETNSNATAWEMESIDFNEIKQKTDIEIRRLGWTKDDGREFLKSRYGKRSRLHLTDEQLLEFLHYLESLPNPG